jgi:hypothetical protein
MLPARDTLASSIWAGFYEEEYGDCRHLGFVLHSHERFHTTASQQGRGHSSHVSALGIDIDPKLMTRSLLGGVLMFAIGILYLVFERAILEDGKSQSELSKHELNHTSRIILGIQLGLVALSMIVTKSSVGYLQARQGIPTPRSLSQHPLRPPPCSHLPPVRTNLYHPLHLVRRSVLLCVLHVPLQLDASGAPGISA